MNFEFDSELSFWKAKDMWLTIFFVTLFRKSLSETGIDCSFITGSVYSRNKAISRFKLGGENNSVILLSLEKSASGTNLTEASHIFFVEPIDATKEHIQEIESQAINY